MKAHVGEEARMPGKKQPFVNNQLVRDIEYIQRNSPDVLVDMGVLMHVLTKRAWAGSYQGWSDVPVDWLGRSSHMGHRRVKAALDRLSEWGMLTSMSTNGRRGPQALNYRYDLRPDYVQLAPEPEVAAYEEEGYESPVVVPQQHVKLTRPPLKSSPEGMYGEIYYFDFDTWQMLPMKAQPSVYATAPVCGTCGRVYHPTEGRGPVEGECTGCYSDRVMSEAIQENDRATLTITTPFGKRMFTVEEMQELFHK